MSKILEVTDLRTYFETRYGTVKAVDGVDITVNKGDTLGIVGESGCGKTVFALSIMRLIPQPPGRIVSGTITFNGVNLLQLDANSMRKLRGKEMAMIFQEPMNSLNPVLRVGEQIAEAVRLHEGFSKKDAMERAQEMLQLVGIASPKESLKSYPHQMSGGMRQRVMIAMAVSCNPKLMLADEPTTALDVTIQAQILDLINTLKKEVGTSVILITHDLGVIAEATQHAAVMYAGKIVEYCSTRELFSRPLHPYTEGLIQSTPRLDEIPGKETRLKVIPGGVPNLYNLPMGCSFQDRCPYVMNVCREIEPKLDQSNSEHFVRCWKYV